MSSNIMNRETLREEHKIDIPSLPILAIRRHVCFRCLSPSEHLSKCAGCKRAVYCGKACQNQDWQVQHKKDCKILKRINAIEVQETVPSRSRELWTLSLMAKAYIIQGLTKDEIPGGIISAQPYCTVCHRSAMQIPQSTILKPCPVCHLVFTCETCPLPLSHECELYQQIGSIEMFRIKQFEDSGQVWCKAPTGTPRSSYRALLTANNWHEYFTEISDKKDLVGNFVKLDFSLDKTILQTLPGLVMQKIEQAWLFLLIATEILTMPLTILAALEDSSNDLPTWKTISIHLVGAHGKEFQNLMIFEEILHLVPSLQTLKIILVGPNSASAAEGTKNEIALESCPACTSRGRERIVTLYRGLYHDYVEESQYQKPDLAVLFHSGRSQAEEESWYPTTKFLVESGTLTLCTTYTHREAQEEVAELDRLGARFVRRPEVNKWKSLVPIPELLEGGEHAMYYNNYYRYIFKGRR